LQPVNIKALKMEIPILLNYTLIEVNFILYIIGKHDTENNRS